MAARFTFISILLGALATAAAQGAFNGHTHTHAHTDRQASSCWRLFMTSLGRHLRECAASFPPSCHSLMCAALKANWCDIKFDATKQWIEEQRERGRESGGPQLKSNEIYAGAAMRLQLNGNYRTCTAHQHMHITFTWRQPEFTMRHQLLAVCVCMCVFRWPTSGCGARFQLWAQARQLSSSMASNILWTLWGTALSRLLVKTTLMASWSPSCFRCSSFLDVG